MRKYREPYLLRRSFIYSFWNFYIQLLVLLYTASVTLYTVSRSFIYSFWFFYIELLVLLFTVSGTFMYSFWYFYIKLCTKSTTYWKYNALHVGYDIFEFGWLIYLFLLFTARLKGRESKFVGSIVEVLN